MNDNTKFAILLDILNRKIADLNIRISKKETDEELNLELKQLLKDRSMLYNGKHEDFCEILKRYGETIND